MTSAVQTHGITLVSRHTELFRQYKVSGSSRMTCINGDLGARGKYTMCPSDILHMVTPNQLNKINLICILQYNKSIIAFKRNPVGNINNMFINIYWPMDVNKDGLVDVMQPNKAASSTSSSYVSNRPMFGLLNCQRLITLYKK